MHLTNLFILATATLGAVAQYEDAQHNSVKYDVDSAKYNGVESNTYAAVGLMSSHISTSTKMHLQPFAEPDCLKLDDWACPDIGCFKPCSRRQDCANLCIDGCRSLGCAVNINMARCGQIYCICPCFAFV
jgi:hypothetical protein